MPVPVAIDDISVELLSEVLDSNVASFTTERIAVGEGFLGELARLTVTYAPGATGPGTVIAKVPTSDSGLKPLGLMLDLYMREYRAYDEIIPQLKIRTPRAYYNAHETGTDDFCLILEDIGHLSAGDQHAGGTLDQARAAMVAAAGLHGRWWGNVDDLDWVPPINSPLNLGLQAMYEEAFPVVVDELGDHLGADLLARIEEWIPTCSDWFESFGDMSYTLSHNDFRLDNMFFDGDELVLIDWQVIGRGDGFGDICPFVSGNLDTEFRRAHEADLLRLYHETINAAGSGYPDFDDVLMSYRTGLNFWLTHWCFTAVTAGASTTRGEELMVRIVTRTADAARQHESWELTGDHSWRPRIER